MIGSTDEAQTIGINLALPTDFRRILVMLEALPHNSVEASAADWDCPACLTLSNEKCWFPTFETIANRYSIYQFLGPWEDRTRTRRRAFRPAAQVRHPNGHPVWILLGYTSRYDGRSRMRCQRVCYDLAHSFRIHPGLPIFEFLNVSDNSQDAPLSYLDDREAVVVGTRPLVFYS